MLATATGRMDGDDRAEVDACDVAADTVCDSVVGSTFGRGGDGPVGIVVGGAAAVAVAAGLWVCVLCACGRGIIICAERWM